MSGQDLGALLPVYFVADESPSMADGNALEQVNEGIASLFRELLRNPLAAAKVRLTITGFSSIVTEHRRLSDIRNDESIPLLQIDNGGTSFRAALGDLLQRIPADVREIQRSGYDSHRPAVFFLTDGEPNPNDNWESTHAQLMDRSSFPYAPNVLAFGFNRAEKKTIASIASNPAWGFIAVPSANVGDVINEIVTSLVRSVVQSGTSLAKGGGTLVIRKPDPQYMEVAADIMPDLNY